MDVLYHNRLIDHNVKYLTKHKKQIKKIEEFFGKYNIKILPIYLSKSIFKKTKTKSPRLYYILQ